MEGNRFTILNEMLRKGERALPVALIDTSVLEANIGCLRAQLNPEAKLRLVAKSLPSWGLLSHLMEKLDTKSLMVFHQPFLSQLARRLPADGDILLGKPMPAKNASYFYKNHNSTAELNPFEQVQWLIDTTARLDEYLEVARSISGQQQLKINLEIDVGLRRGGFDSLDTLRLALQTIAANPDHLKFSGLMGYDPHIAKIPEIVRSTKSSLKAANQFYDKCKQLIKEEFHELWSDSLTFNGAGSPTFHLHRKNSPLNDISVGSALLKPTTFDIPALGKFEPACYIATPVLKVFDGTTLPALERAKSFFNLIPSMQKSAFLYGGYWKANYCYPPGLQRNKLFGDSTNQTMVNFPARTKLEVDDFVFLRPHQSEFVLLQFGDLLAVRHGEIVDRWPVLKN